MAHDNLNPWLRSALLMVLGSGLLLILGGYLIYKDIENRHRHQAERELLLVNQLQLQNLRTWRKSRLTDAQTLMGDVPFSRIVAQWHQADAAGLPAEPALRALIQSRLRLLREQAGYDAVYLVGADGELLLTPTGIIPGYLPAAEADALRRAWDQAQPMTVEPRRDLTFAFPFFSLLAPVYFDDEPIAAVWMVMDVRASLYPLLEKWPSVSQTAESALVVDEGGRARVLTPLRGLPDAAPSLLIAPDRPDDPMLQAIQGMRGLFYAHDYRGQPVIAMASSVTGSPWYLVSKVDAQEALTSRWDELWRIAAPVMAGLLCVWLVLAYMQHKAWRRERELKHLLELQVRQDPLTGVANRLALDERLREDWHRAVRHGTPLSVLMIDVDNFKRYNDHYGHVTGDQCLRRVAEVISTVASRATDLVARYGGEEFVVLLPDTPAERARSLAQAICTAVYETAQEHPYSTHEQRVTVSIGVADLRHDPASDRHFELVRKNLLERADAALYAAKSAGKNRVKWDEMVGGTGFEPVTPAV
ncbi:MAG: sensor domain-containing diguanylate cyclase [Castellaniella sp.]|uniref:GGDEF domain-containing protein n=1 Tax=Castellaniella sp. TaxID=1955812 RepID=UPI003C72830C